MQSKDPSYGRPHGVAWLLILAVASFGALTGIPAQSASHPTSRLNPSPQSSSSTAPAPSPSPQRFQASSPAASSTTPPIPSPSSSGAASPAPRPFRLSTDVFSTLIDQATNGPGQFPAEAPSFLAGFPAAPGTPYDLLSTNVQTPGVAGHAQLRLQAIGDLRNYEGGIELGAGYVRGSAAQAGYWSEPLLPTLNPHLGAQVFPLPITFPFHAGQDDVTAFRTSIVSGYVQTHDQRVRVQGGFLNLGQSDGFVFQQPAIPNVIPGLAPQIAESIGKGAPIADQWAASATNLPLQGIDIQVHPGALSAEISDVGLPAIATTPARATIVSIVFDRKDAVRLSAEMAHITTGGAPDITPIYFGSSQSITPTAQGQIPTSTIGGQRSTVAGVRAEGRNVLGLDAVAEIGRSSYEADEIAHPGTRGRGGFYHLGASKTVGRVTAGSTGIVSSRITQRRSCRTVRPRTSGTSLTPGRDSG